MIKGINTALVTPMKNGAIDFAALERLVDRQLEASVDGLVICATTGEGTVLTVDERANIISAIVKQVQHRIRVVVGTGYVATHATIEATRRAADLGADAALVVSPAYVLPSQEGIAAHYEAVADKGGLPVIAYNVPSRTSSDILPATLARIARHDNIIGLKEASGSVLRIQQVIAQTKGRLDVVSGDDAVTLSLLVAGGKGVICTGSNVAPGHWVALFDAWTRGDLEGAQAAQAQLIELHEVLFTEANPGPVKAALHLLGLVEPEIRLPLTWATRQTRQKLVKALLGIGLHPKEIGE